MGVILFENDDTIAIAFAGGVALVLNGLLQVMSLIIARKAARAEEKKRLNLNIEEEYEFHCCGKDTFAFLVPRRTGVLETLYVLTLTVALAAFSAYYF